MGIVALHHVGPNASLVALPTSRDLFICAKNLLVEAKAVQLFITTRAPCRRVMRPLEPRGSLVGLDQEAQQHLVSTTFGSPSQARDLGGGPYHAVMPRALRGRFEPLDHFVLGHLSILGPPSALGSPHAAKRFIGLAIVVRGCLA